LLQIAKGGSDFLVNIYRYEHSHYDIRGLKTC